MNLQTGAIEPSAPMLRGKQQDGARYELSWGYPYWDKEKLERWGVIMTAEGKRKKKKNKKKVKARNESEIESVAQE